MDIGAILKSEYNDRMEEMRDLILYLNETTKAYDEGNPIISDRQWDEKYYRLCLLEKETGKFLPGSPTHSIYFEVKDKLDKIIHEHPMLSLDKTKDVDVIKSFLGNREWVAMGKMDGLTCSLTYENGELVRAETRGNGEEGEDILHNAKATFDIPNKIDYKDRVVLDGEIICDYEEFKRWENDFKNPRNFAAGSIRLLDSYECCKRMLKFVVWDVIEPFKDVENNLFTQIFKAGLYGFRTVPIIADTNETVEDAIEYIKYSCELAKYPIDGIVFKFNNLNLRESLGSTSHHFNNAIAFKFFDELYETKLKDIEWTMGRTGVLTPVAIFDPVDADGSIIERASLHNISVMEEILGAAYKGQKIQVFKANQIIPQIDSAEGQEVGKEVEFIEIPKICPVCGQPTHVMSNPVDDVRLLVCSNPNCEGKLINRLDHFFGLKGLNAKGISKATFEKLIEWGWLNNLCDVYKLDNYIDEWKQKSGFGEKSVNKILNSIKEVSENVSWEKYLCAIGIPLIGSTVSKDLSKVFHSWSEFRQAVKDGYKFYDLPNFGIEKHNSIIKFDYEESDKLAELYIKFAEPKEEKKETELNTLQGKTFVITGKLQNFKNRNELIIDIEKYGGKVASSVSKNTNYLINNDKTSTSAKNLSAQKLGIPIISEEDYRELTLHF